MGDFDIDLLRTINHNRILALDPVLIAITDTAFLVAITIPTVLLITGFIKDQRSLKSMALQLYLSLAIVTFIVNALKHYINRSRPFVNHSFIQQLTDVVTPSFPSGHTTDACIMAFGITLMTRKPWFLMPVWLWALAVSYSRMALGVHYPSDILASMVLSLLVAMFCKWLFIKIDAAKSGRSQSGE